MNQKKNIITDDDSSEDEVKLTKLDDDDINREI